MRDREKERGREGEREWERGTEREREGERKRGKERVGERDGERDSGREGVHTCTCVFSYIISVYKVINTYFILICHRFLVKSLLFPEESNCTVILAFL